MLYLTQLCWWRRLMFKQEVATLMHLPGLREVDFSVQVYVFEYS